MRFESVRHRLRWGTVLGAGLLAASTLGGCELGPNFHNPHPHTAASFLDNRPAITAPNGVSQGKVDLAWWRSFGDPALTNLETQAIQQNLDVRIATQRLAEAQAQAQIEGATLYPNLNFAGSFTREGPSKKGVFTALSGSGSNTSTSTNAGSTAGGSASSIGGGGIPGSAIQPFNLFQYGFSSVFDFDLWGKNRRAVEASLAAVQASRDARRAVLLNTEAEVAQTYVNLRAEQTVMQITKDNLKSADHIAGLTGQRAQAGLANALDVADARAQAASIRSKLPALETAIDADINQLSLLLGRGPEALRAELITAAPVPAVPPVVPIGLPSALLQRRPDVREASAKLHEATAEIGVAKADFFPDVSLSGSVSLQALQFSNLNQLAAVTYAIGPQITLPLFEGGKLNGQLHLRTAEQKAAAIDYAKTVLTAFHQVDNALTAYDQEQNTFAALKTDVAESQRALGLAQERYREGLADYLQVLTAQQSELAASQSEAESLAQVSTDLVKLYQALGGGWEQTYPAAPRS
ncbi:MAG: RND transporter [Acidiphilium sp. 37-64-53]|uniref:efflux transporter outer membrane subunit n=1 Tax=Acidiphilium TaxID=522 RepID=UPI000BD98131|nr:MULTISPECIES: efflux transporter outer membrane subunit [Acidiphilium]OYW01685.1 MAG: RND transporter [Acidiphilium sp. 37-64-53]OZB30038.1 MAG: RND transporter [Acidiphilium sp. 34-64-41]HQT83705.1 efflux transporter outer membrane subunit [Acidiphilium rubrum]